MLKSTSSLGPGNVLRKEEKTMKKLGKRINAGQTIEAYMPPCGYCYCYCDTAEEKIEERYLDTTKDVVVT